MGVRRLNGVKRVGVKVVQVVVTWFVVKNEL